MGWVDDLRPASFRGVPFFADSHRRVGGRHVAGHEFPLRSTWSAEDMGPRQRVYHMMAYVLAPPGGSYFSQRAALNEAFDAPGSGTLVHPWLGTLTVFCAINNQTETGERGGEASWELEFLDAGSTPSPVSQPDTSGGLLSGLGSWVSLAVQAYAIGSLIAERPGILLGIAESYLGGLASSFLGISPSVLSSLTGVIGGLVASATAGVGPVTSSITGATGDPVAIAVTDAFTAAAMAVVAAIPPPVVDNPVLGTGNAVSAMPPDPSGGLAALASWAPPAVFAGGLQAGLQAQLQTQFTALVQGAATYATAQVYAGIDFVTANAAAAARSQLLALLNAQILAAAAAYDDAMTMAWMGLTGLAANDLTQRVQRLPLLIPYTSQRSLPAPALAQRLYQDGSRGDQLAAFNSVFHPGFMPVSGVALSQ